MCVFPYIIFHFSSGARELDELNIHFWFTSNNKDGLFHQKTVTVVTPPWKSDCDWPATRC